ncbi:HPr family phosphocarrier protein [Parvularcula sp. LCG005]|uniref:HPr family phosphocarrier protein n=1 Tax=Parvularcula sp. LCG005 TaxID=3078805 RepID=UPI0029424ED8|nr:HPr family phosphocarrier protein [Parvularcula sp. LCG005]WOI53177.1 HPr family phosphocarrier protein [Parvularcula sp. LCG005]
MSDVTAELEIVNNRGLHARASAKFCALASAFQSRIDVSKDGITVGARSLQALLMLGAGKGSTILLEAQGDDAREAVDALSQLVADKFGEEA